MCVLARSIIFIGVAGGSAGLVLAGLLFLSGYCARRSLAD